MQISLIVDTCVSDPLADTSQKHVSSLHISKMFVTVWSDALLEP